MHILSGNFIIIEFGGDINIHAINNGSGNSERVTKYPISFHGGAVMATPGKINTNLFPCI